MRKNYNMHLLWAQLLHNYFKQGENIGVKHNRVFLWLKVSFYVSMGGRTESYVICSL